MGQRYEPAPNTQHPAQKNRVFDPILYRHFFQSIEADFEKLFERRFRHLESLEKKLGSDEVFKLPDSEQKRLHKQVETVQWELDTLTNYHDFLKSITEKTIEAHGRLSAEYFEAIADRDKYKEWFENLCLTSLLETEFANRQTVAGR